MTTYNHWFLRARLKTRQLLLLVAIGEEGNIHRAAEVLNMTQPAASKMIKELEEELEVQLFERLPRGVQPTWYGESLIRHAHMILTNLDHAHDELSALKAGRFGRVAVGAITSPGLSLLPPAIAMVKQEQPSLAISLDIETSPVLVERLEQGKLDILIGRLFAGHDTTSLRYQPLVEESVCAVARSGHPMLGMDGLTLGDVVTHGWIVPPAGSVLRHRFDLMFRAAGFAPPDNLIETAALLFITRMLQHSDLLAVLAADVAHYYAAHGIISVLPIELPCHMDAFGIITRTDRLPSPAAKVMMRALKAVSLTLYGRGLEAD